MQGERGGAQQSVEAGGLQERGVRFDEPGREVVAQVGEGFAVRGAEPFQVVDLAALGHAEGGGDRPGGGFEPVDEDAGAGRCPAASRSS